MRKSVKSSLRVWLGCSLALSLPMAARADIIVKPYTFTPSTPAQAAQVNANFDTIYNNYNGNITNANVKANAGIAFSKLSFTTQLGPILRSLTQPCVTVGATGDPVWRWGAYSDGSLQWGDGTNINDCQIKRLSASVLQFRSVNPSAFEYGSTFNAGKLQVFELISDTYPGVIIDGSRTPYAPGISLGAGASANVSVKLTAGSGGLSVTDPTVSTPMPVYCSGLVLTAATPSASVTVPIGFGGSGQDGAITQNTATFTGPKRYSATTFSVPAAQIVTVNDGSLNINATSNVNISGNITMATSALTNGGLGGGTGSTSLTGAPGGGAGGGQTTGYTGAGGNGGSSFLFSGGAGGHNGTSGQAGFAQPPNGQLLTRSGAGSGGNSIVMTATSNGGTGGSSQFPLAILAVGSISMPSGGSITVTGGAGTAGVVATTNNAAGGGAGGAAGNVLAASQTSVTFASGSTFSGVGGAGGAAGRNVSGNAGGGGGGAPSSLVMWSPANTNAGTVTLTGGAGGAAIGTGAAGETPATGSVTSIVGTPNIPLITHFNNHPDKYRPYLAILHQLQPTERQVEVPHNMMCQIASEGDIVKYCKLKTERGLQPLSESTCLGVGDNTITEALKNAS